MLDVYATVDDLIDRFGEAEMIGLTDPDNTAVQSARAQRKLDDAHALANGYVGMAYRLPLAGCAKGTLADHCGRALGAASAAGQLVECQIVKHAHA